LRDCLGAPCPGRSPSSAPASSPRAARAGLDRRGAVALFGVWPRGLLIPWLVFTYGALVGIFAPLLQPPEWMEWLSPIGLTSLVPAVELEVVPLVGLTLVAAGLMAVGLLGFARRDLQSPA
jgi:ABC-2 type transport system permease protein